MEEQERKVTMAGTGIQREQLTGLERQWRQIEQLLSASVCCALQLTRMHLTVAWNCRLLQMTSAQALLRFENKIRQIQKLTCHSY